MALPLAGRADAPGEQASGQRLDDRSSTWGATKSGGAVSPRRDETLLTQKGRASTIGGDTAQIGGERIRLNAVDAPELPHSAVTARDRYSDVGRTRRPPWTIR